MDICSLQTLLAELMDEISGLPSSDRGTLEILAKDMQRCRGQLHGSIKSLQESLDWLRVSAKYLVFDLEATRRENACLREMLEHNGKEGWEII